MRQAYDYWQDQPGSIHRSQQSLDSFSQTQRKLRVGRGLDRHLLPEGQMCFAGTELLRVTADIFSVSESSTDYSSTKANKAMPSRKENKRQFVCLRLPHEGEAANNVFVQTQQYHLDRYATQAPNPIIECYITREVTEKDRWSVVRCTST